MDAFADHLDELARRTWFNVAEAKRLGMRMGEVTITEANLLSVAQFVAATGLSADLVPTKADEAVTGADFEIWFEVRGKIAGYTFQAKVVTVGAASYTYRGIGKKDKLGTSQAVLLERHALDVGAFPFHLLFNGWATGLSRSPALPSTWPAAHFGCAAIATPKVRRIRSTWPTRRANKAEHFLPESVPWSELFRPGSVNLPLSGDGADGDRASGTDSVAGRQMEAVLMV